MQRFFLPAFAGAMLLGGCGDLEAIPPGPPPSPLPAEPADLTVELNQPTEEAKPIIEEIAARCWLDGVVGAGAMLVDRDTGQIIMSNDTQDLLTVDFMPSADLARMRLSGPIVANPGKAEQLLAPITIHQRTGEITCPELPS